MKTPHQDIRCIERCSSPFP